MIASRLPRNVVAVLAIVTAAGTPSMLSGAQKTFDFNGAAYGVPDANCVNNPVPPLFNRPEYGFQTSTFIINPAGCGEGAEPGSDGSDAFLTSALAASGSSEALRFSWENEADDETWARVVTFTAGGVTPLFPSPIIHVGNGSKVSMKVALAAFDAAKNQLAPGSGALQFALAFRETGENLPLGASGSGTGSVEFLGIDSVAVGTVGNYPVGGAELPINFSFTTIEWTFGPDPTQVSVSIGGGPAVTKSILSFAGDGELCQAGSPCELNKRGTLDSLIIMKPATDDTSKKWFVWIDDLVIDSGAVLDPVKVDGPILESVTAVTVSNIDPAATEVRLYRDAGLLATKPAPFSGGDSHEFTGLSLGQGEVLTATQVIGGNESDPSSPVTVLSAVVYSENFDGYANQAAFDAVWLVSGTVAPDILLADDQAASCPQSAKAQPAGTGGASLFRRYIDLQTVAGLVGGVNGSDDVPLWITFYFYHGSGGNQRNWFDARSYTSGTLAGGALTHLYSFGCYNGLNPVTSYQARDNGDGGPDWFVLTEARKNNTWVRMQIKLTESATEYYVDDVLAGSTARFGANDPITTLVVGSGASNANVPAWWDNISLSLGTTATDPFGPPISPPIVAGPIGAGDTSVELNGVDPAASQVTVYADGNPIGSAPGNASATVTVPVAPLVKGETLSATQTVGPGTSCLPAIGPVVGAGGNTEVRLTLSIRDKAGLTGPLGTDALTGGQLEWIGAATSIGGSSGAPQGKVFLPSNQWQTVEFRVATGLNDDVIYPSPGFAGTGDGIINNLPWAAIEHLAVSINAADPNTGPYTLYIDNVKNGDDLLTDFETFSVGDVQRLFNQPTFSGTTSSNLLVPPNLSTVTNEQADTGNQSLKINFQFLDEATTRWVRLTTVGAVSLANPQVDLTKPITMRILFLPTFACNNPYADANGDTFVDALDFAQLQLCLTAAGEPILPGCECWDRDNDLATGVPDGSVTQADLPAFLACAATSGPAIPADPACDD